MIFLKQFFFPSIKEKFPQLQWHVSQRNIYEKIVTLISPFPQSVTFYSAIPGSQQNEQYNPLPLPNMKSSCQTKSSLFKSSMSIKIPCFSRRSCSRQSFSATSTRCRKLICISYFVALNLLFRAVVVAQWLSTRLGSRNSVQVLPGTDYRLR